MKRITAILCLLTASVAALAQSTAEGVFQTDVADVTNQEILVLEVTYPPGAESNTHRHKMKSWTSSTTVYGNSTPPGPKPSISL